MRKFKYYFILSAFFIGVIIFLTNKQMYYADTDEIVQEHFVLLSSFVPFFTLLILIGGSILLTLSYVSWRKYKGYKLNKKIKKRNSNN